MNEKKYKEKWAALQDLLNTSTTELSYKTWFEPLLLDYINDEKNTIHIIAPNPLVIKVLNERYLQLLKSCIAETYERNLSIIFQLKADETRQKKTLKIKEYEDEYYFNPKFRFNNFVVGEHNKLAHAAAVAVAEAPSTAFNPLFIYGGSGLGKTHLMHAIGCHILDNHPDLTVLYVSSEMFTNELIDAIRDTKDNKKKMDAFKDKYRHQDVLLIDDIQFIEGKTQTEIELFNTFNELYSHNKQIILSSDRPPNKLVNLDERLRSRFGSNMVVDIQAPDFETRVAILQQKAEDEGIEMTDELYEVISLIAEKIKFNVRELESALTRVTSFSAMMNEAVTVRFARDVLKDIISGEETRLSPEIIKKKVCKKFGVKISDMESSKRARVIAYPRQIAMYLCRELTDLSYPQIGKYFGNRDHTTVLHAYEKIKGEIGISEETKTSVNELLSILKGE